MVFHRERGLHLTVLISSTHTSRVHMRYVPSFWEISLCVCTAFKWVLSWGAATGSCLRTWWAVPFPGSAGGTEKRRWRFRVACSEDTEITSLTSTRSRAVPALGAAFLISLSPYNYVNSSAILGRFAVSLITVDSSEDLSRKVWISPPFCPLFALSFSLKASTAVRGAGRGAVAEHSALRTAGGGAAARGRQGRRSAALQTFRAFRTPTGPACCQTRRSPQVPSNPAAPRPRAPCFSQT